MPTLVLLDGDGAVHGLMQMLPAPVALETTAGARDQATLAIALNVDSAARLHGRPGVSFADVDGWRQHVELAFGLDIPVERVELALVASTPQAADAALDGLRRTATRHGATRFDRIIVIARDAGLHRRLMGSTCADPYRVTAGRFARRREAPARVPTGTPEPLPQTWSAAISRPGLAQHVAGRVVDVAPGADLHEIAARAAFRSNVPAEPWLLTQLGPTVRSLRGVDRLSAQYRGCVCGTTVPVPLAPFDWDDGLEVRGPGGVPADGAIAAARVSMAGPGVMRAEGRSAAQQAFAASVATSSPASLFVDRRELELQVRRGVVLEDDVFARRFAGKYVPIVWTISPAHGVFCAFDVQADPLPSAWWRLDVTTARNKEKQRVPADWGAAPRVVECTAQVATFDREVVLRAPLSQGPSKVLDTLRTGQIGRARASDAAAMAFALAPVAAGQMVARPRRIQDVDDAELRAAGVPQHSIRDLRRLPLLAIP